MSSFHCNNELLALAPIKYTRTDTKNSQSILNLVDFLILIENILNKNPEKKMFKEKADIFKKQCTDIILSQIIFRNAVNTNEIARS